MNRHAVGQAATRQTATRQTATRQKLILQAAILHAALAQLALVIGGCQSARQEPRSDVELRRREFESQAAQVTDDVQSSFLQVRERAAAGTLSDAARKTLGSSFADNVKQAEARAATPKAMAPARASAAGERPSRALEPGEAVRFRRLKSAIERANAEVERHRPRAP